MTAIIPALMTASNFDTPKNNLNFDTPVSKNETFGKRHETISKIPISKTAPDPSKLNETTSPDKIIRQLNESTEKRPEMMSMLKAKKNIRHGLGPVRGEDQKTLDVFFRESPRCPVCHGLYQTGTLSSWIDGHILDCHISMPQYSGPYQRNDADMWFSKTYLPWIKEKFGADLL